MYCRSWTLQQWPVYPSGRSHDKLANDLIAAAKSSNDPSGECPIEDAYQEQLKSNFADMANIGGQPAGCVTAACFLERFTKKYTWAHLDIAGTHGKAEQPRERPAGRFPCFAPG